MTFNVIRKRALSRRGVLRGAGAGIALPLLGGMIPAMTAQAKTASNSPLRLGIVYEGNGAALDYWIPKSVGADFEMSATLRPLEPFRSKVLVLSGLDNDPAKYLPGDPGGGHGRCTPAFLNAHRAKPTDGTDYRAATTIDQIAAEKIGARTQLRSLEIALEGTEFQGTCDAGYSCAYTSTISWSGPTRPLAMENNPRAVFETLFGDSKSTTKAQLAQRLAERKSVLDSLGSGLRDLQRDLGAGDNSKLSDFLESLRESERRIELAEAETPDLPKVERPTGVPASLAEYSRLMYDLQLLAFQTDTTRVGTFMTIRELSSRTYPELGAPGSHHSISHHRDDPELIAQLHRINHFHMQQFAYYLERLQATEDGDGTLLDHVLIMKGSGMGNSNMHDPTNLPILLAGGAGGRIKGGRHLNFKGAPVANLYVKLLNTIGIPTETIGNSTGQLDI